MEGGKYTAWFPDDERRELRAILYQLENLNLVKLDREKIKTGCYTYKWSLTKTGKDIVGKNEHLQKIKEEGDTFNFLKSLKEIYDKKEFFIP